MTDSRLVAIIEDEPPIALIVHSLLKKRSYIPMMFPSYEKALKEIENKTFSCVFADIFMPGMGGVVGIKQIKHLDCRIPVIAMTGGWDGLDADSTLRAAQRCGADAGLKKPFFEDDLAAALLAVGDLSSFTDFTNRDVSEELA